MAQNFTVKDYTNPSASANSMAVIDCGESACYGPGGSVIGPGAAASSKPCKPSEAYECKSPKFLLNLAAITLPGINQTADKIKDAVDSGQCKIIADPTEGEILYLPTGNGTLSMSANTSNINLVQAGNDNLTALLTGLGLNDTANANTSFAPLYGDWKIQPHAPVNYTGKPVSIACGLPQLSQESLNPNTNYSSATNISITSANSTDSYAVVYVPPPAAKDFAQYTVHNGVCFSSSKSQVQWCLPNGTYPLNQGAFGFKAGDFDTLSSNDPSAQIVINLNQITGYNGRLVGGTPPTSGGPSTYFPPQTSTSGMHDSLGLGVSEQVQIKIASLYQPLGMCIYSKPNFLGDAWCMGAGGTNFTTNLVNKAQSLTLAPGMVAWLYPGYYGNPLGEYVTTSVADLSSIPYHSGSTLAGILAAAWVFNITDTKGSG